MQHDIQNQNILQIMRNLQLAPAQEQEMSEKGSRWDHLLGNKSDEIGDELM